MDTAPTDPWIIGLVESAATASLDDAPAKWAPTAAVEDGQLGQGPWVVACIGFSGDLRGSLAFVGRPDVLPSVCTCVDESSDEGLACDALGEFANLTLGRLKVLLLERGIVVTPAIPTSLVGRRIELSHPVGTVCEWLAFRCARGVVHVRVDLDMTGCPAPRAIEEEEVPMGEGQALLF